MNNAEKEELKSKHHRFILNEGMIEELDALAASTPGFRSRKGQAEFQSRAHKKKFNDSAILEYLMIDQGIPITEVIVEIKSPDNSYEVKCRRLWLMKQPTRSEQKRTKEVSPAVAVS